MANSQDIALDQNDLVIFDGDLAVAISDEQHIADTINAFPGWWKQEPQDGVGIFQYINSSGKEQELARSVRMQLQDDGYSVNNPIINIDPSGLLTVNPNAAKI